MAKTKDCPMCGKTATDAYKPFCSERCKNLDLGKWLKGDYAVPVVEMDDLPDDEELTNSDTHN